jgi:hypothetical protein
MERAYQRKVLRQHIDGTVKASSPVISFSNFFGLTSKETVKSSAQNDDDEGAESRGDVEEGAPVRGGGSAQPAALQGWADKKGQKKFGVSGGWQPRYFSVIKPGILVYYKDTLMEGEPNGEVNLGLVMSFTLTTKDDGDKDDGDSKIKLELDLADKTFKMRFPDMAEATAWRSGLLAWKEYCIANDEDDDDDGDKTSSDDGVQLSNVYASAETGSSEDETAALTKNMSSSSAPLDFSNTLHRESDSFSMEISDRPSALEGWLEKKQQAKFGKMAQWQKRYFKVDEESGCILYFKSTSPQDVVSGTIDLRMIVDVSAPEKDGKVDAVRFNIDIGDKVFKIRAPSTAEGERWIVLLNMWRDYIILK